MSTRGQQVLVGLFIAVGAWASAAPHPAAAAGWLAQVNAYRASAGLPPVAEDPTLSVGDADHSKYLVENNADGHTEDATRPFSTPQGAAAGRQSDVMVDYKTSTSDEDAVNLWMTGPFHSIAIVDPNLQSAGFGSYRASKPGAEQMAASLNVLAGRVGTTPPTTRLPVLWPGDGSTVPLTSYTGTESPDPLTSCAGYTAPTGLPLLLEMGHPGTAVTASSLTVNGQPAPSCEFDATNYTNPNAQDQSEARSLLAARGAVVLVPRNPLTPGSAYTATVTVDAVPYSWTFRAGLGTLATASTPLVTQTPRAPHHLAPTAHAPAPPTSAPAPAPPAIAPAKPAVVALVMPEARTSTPLPDAALPLQAAPAELARTYERASRQPDPSPAPWWGAAVLLAGFVAGGARWASLRRRDRG